jgi:hypothetical protein
MRHLSIVLVSAGLVIGLAGCATKSDNGSSRDRHLITAEEIREVEARTAYEAIRRLRPAFLRRGRPTSGSGARLLPSVYVDGVRMRGVADLRRIYAHEIDEIRFMPGPEATTRFGTGHPAGAILVTTVNR